MCTSFDPINLSPGKSARSCKRPLLSLVDFPSLERRLLKAILRQGPIALDLLVKQSGQSPDTAMSAIERLIQQGWLVHDPTTHRVRYRIENSTKYR